ncbi:MAG: phosphonate ABC transporter, permease protein PhnE [Thermodesulfobacteriota bacterium]
MLLLWGGMMVCRFDPIVLIKGIPRGIELIGHMVPPAWGKTPELVGPAMETVQIAFVGTVLGAILSFIVGIIAARNMHSIRIVRDFTRILLSAERALPDLIVMLFFVAIVGLGAFPGVMALVASSVGMLGKLFADAIEEIDPKPIESLEAIGATRIQIIYYSVLPQVLPSIIANTLYRFEVNIRMSILLGVVGAGGIGFNLVTSIRLMRYQEAMAIILIILILVTFCEKFSDLLRKIMIGKEVLR